MESARRVPWGDVVEVEEMDEGIREEIREEIPE
jgi:hypothetical protein